MIWTYSWLLFSVFVLGQNIPDAVLQVSQSSSLFGASLANKRATGLPLQVTNSCPQVIYPAFLTQAGTGPAVGGLELDVGASQTLTVSSDWQGRVWGRTNCSFNSAGTGASNNGGLNGGGEACVTGDCNGELECAVSVSHQNPSFLRPSFY